MVIENGNEEIWKMCKNASFLGQEKAGRFRTGLDYFEVTCSDRVSSGQGLH